MKRFIMILAIILFSFTTSFTQNKEIKIVVADFDVFLIKKQYGSIVSDIIISKMSSEGKVSIIERAKLNKVIQELRLGQSGLINPDQAARTGKMTGANHMIVGSVGKLGVKYVVNARIIDIETGKVIKGFSLSGNSVEDIGAMTTTMSYLLLQVIQGKPVSVPHRIATRPGKKGGKPEKKKRPSLETITGYWNTEWYDGKGKHSGAMYLRQNGTTVTGWTIESIGPARITATVKDNEIKGKYFASYGGGKFEFTISEDKSKLLGSYTAGHGVHNTWNGWRRDIKRVPMRVGMKIFADWSRDIWSYPGKITKIKDRKFFVEYDDGDKEWLDSGKIFPQHLKSGDVIYVSQRNRSRYTYATILKIKGNQVFVEYQNGNKKWEPVKGIRLLRVRKTGYN